MMTAAAMYVFIGILNLFATRKTTARWSGFNAFMGIMFMLLMWPAALFLRFVAFVGEGDIWEDNW